MLFCGLPGVCLVSVSSVGVISWVLFFCFGAMAANLGSDISRTVNLNKKREDYISWEDYFMAVAFLSAQRSKDPSTQVGACIVNSDKKIVGIGYNGMPNGCDDDALPWKRTADDVLETKYPYVCHAEMNAILNKNAASVGGCTIYVALFPCNECSKLIIQSGIKRVVYMSDKHHDKPEMKASRRLLDLARVEYIQHKPKRSKFVIDFNEMRQTPSKEQNSSQFLPGIKTS